MDLPVRCVLGSSKLLKDRHATNPRRRGRKKKVSRTCGSSLSSLSYRTSGNYGDSALHCSGDLSPLNFSRYINPIRIRGGSLRTPNKLQPLSLFSLQKQRSWQETCYKNRISLFVPYSTLYGIAV